MDCVGWGVVGWVDCVGGLLEVTGWMDELGSAMAGVTRLVDCVGWEVSRWVDCVE